MKADRKDIFKKVIKQAAADKAPAGFTDNVMMVVEAEVAREQALKTLLQAQPVDSIADIDFTAGVMAQLNANVQRTTNYQPVISKKAWYGVAACVAFFLVVIGLSNSAQQAAGSKNIVSGGLQYVYGLPPMYLMVFVVVGVLLMADYIITQRGNKPELV